MKKSNGLVILIVLISVSIVSHCFADGLNGVYRISGNTLFIVGNNGVIYRSPDGGQTIQDKSIGTTNYNSVCSFSLDIWIAGDNGTLLLSTNNGVAFTQTTVPGTGNIESVSFVNISTGWICCSNGNIYMSTNGGVNWSQQTSPVTTALRRIKFSDANTGVACGDNGAILITTNGGANWNYSATLINNNLLSIDLNGSTIVASGADAAVIKSTNFGASWSKIDYKVSTKPDIGGICMTGPTTFFSCGIGGAIRKTVDGGQTFTFLKNPAWVDLGYLYFYDSTHGLALGTNTNMIIRTLNGGEDWFMPNGVSQSLSWVLKIPLQFYTSSGNDFCQSWWNKKEIFVTKSNTLYRTLDLGESWSVIGQPMPYGSVSNSFLISPHDTNIFVVAIDSDDQVHGKVLRSTDYGSTWNATFSGNRSSDGIPIGQDPNHPDTLYYSPEDSTMFRSTNFGLTWSAVGTYRFNEECAIKVMEGNSNTIIVGSAGVYPNGSSHVTRSTDFGLTWTVIDSAGQPLPEIPNIVGTPLSDYIYAAFYEGDVGGIKRSSNQGASWTNINIDNAVWGFDIARDDPNMIVYTLWADAPGITGYYSMDKGVHFTELPEIPAAGSFAVYAYNRNTIFLQQPLGYYKLKVTVSSPIGIQPISTEIPKQFSLSQNYPNPFNPNTKIKFDIPNTVGVAYMRPLQLKIYDILGREVAKLVDQQLQPGSYSVDWDASNYPSGVYFYRIQTDNFTETKKMILMK
jgi:photosystem II stability/assembly factor-like uncharacterized protein